MKAIGEKIADGIQKFYTAFINQRVLTTSEEVQANTNEKNLASAVVVGEIYNNLMFPDGTHFYPDKQGDEYGYNTDAARGADTFRPFKSLPDIVIEAVSGSDTYHQTTSTIYVPKGYSKLTTNKVSGLSINSTAFNGEISNKTYNVAEGDRVSIGANYLSTCSAYLHT